MFDGEYFAHLSVKKRIVGSWSNRKIRYELVLLCFETKLIFWLIQRVYNIRRV